MTDSIVVKLGGVAGKNLTKQFFEKIHFWKNQGKQVVVVHGGGNDVSRMMQKLNIQVKIVNGLRVTSKEALDVTKMVLIGQVQPNITNQFLEQGLPVVGLNAADQHCLIGDYVDQAVYGNVGSVTQVNVPFFETLLKDDIIPIIAPLALTEFNQWLNVNADDTACKIAESLKAESLYLLTDVPGIKVADDWIDNLSLEEAADLKHGVLTGGMIPKVEHAVSAVQKGVRNVHITDCIHETGTTISWVEVRV
ncbi:acetylglutamate kinase [Vagococcus elongatus]|uniref:Acetylglutamate kinase n=1 Tax=Vagococcus elongatus TaxID=180344 RepID=A0A430AZL2_9ENTE|nr:acetylglutamate kinase [Vagococcus elongatus]RSU13510.1 acetylglutamate kinase [Vagococcus elongatus]